MTTRLKPALEIEISNLARLPLFREAGRDALNALAFNADARMFKADEVVFQQGEDGDDAWLILSGDARVMYRDENGRTSAAPVSPGMLAGESALFQNTRRRCTLTAQTDLCALRITRATFLRALEAYPALATSVGRAVNERLLAGIGALRAPVLS